MREYYKEKLSNIREVFRGIILLALALISGVGGLFFYLIKNGFEIKIFILISFGFVNIAILLLILGKLYKMLEEVSEKLKEN